MTRSHLSRPSTKSDRRVQRRSSSRIRFQRYTNAADRAIRRLSRRYRGAAPRRTRSSYSRGVGNWNSRSRSARLTSSETDSRTNVASSLSAWMTISSGYRRWIRSSASWPAPPREQDSQSVLTGVYRNFALAPERSMSDTPGLSSAICRTLASRILLTGCPTKQKQGPRTAREYARLRY